MPLDINVTVELVFLPPLALLGLSLGHFHDAKVPDADLSVEIVSWDRPRVGHDDHNLRDIALVLYPWRTEDVLVGGDAHLLFVSEKEKTAFIHHDQFQLAKDLAGCLVDPIADEVNLVLLLSIGTGMLDAASHVSRSELVKPLLSSRTVARSPTADQILVAM